MLLIRCPWCGERAQTEFTYTGDAAPTRPDSTESLAEAWYEYIYLRANPRGRHDELWHHAAGCRRFVKVRRNTLTHEIIGTAPPHDEIAK